MTHQHFSKFAGPALSWAILLGAAAAIISAAPAAASQSPFATLVAAERAFARDAGRIGVGPAFRAHAAADAVLIQPDPAPAAALLAGPDGPGDTSLHWQPGVAGMARSNDLGFTTGPYRLTAGGKVTRGQYLTVWQRDGDGPWKWVLDHGSFPVVGDLTAPMPTQVFRMNPGTAAKGNDGKALAADEALNAALVQSGGAALKDMLASDALILRPGREPMGRPSAASDDTLSRVGTAEHIATRESKAGDMAVSYGRFTAGPDARAGHYVRVWRRGPDGWRVIVDELTWRQP